MSEATPRKHESPTSNLNVSAQLRTALQIYKPELDALHSRGHSIALDLGCGEPTAELGTPRNLRYMALRLPDWRVIGVDPLLDGKTVSHDMKERVMYMPVDLRSNEFGDFLRNHAGGVGLVAMFFVLRFIQPEDAIQIMKAVHAATAVGGIHTGQELVADGFGGIDPVTHKENWFTPNVLSQLYPADEWNLNVTTTSVSVLGTTASSIAYTAIKNAPGQYPTIDAF